MINKDKFNESGKTKKPFYKKGWFIALIIALVIVTIADGGDKTDETVKKDSVNKVVEEEPKEEIKLNELQELYLSFTDDITKEEVENKIAESGLAYSEHEYANGPTIKIALTKGQSKLKYADSGGDYTKISFNKELEVEVVVYFDNDKFLELIDYRNGTYYSLNNQPEYKGYYISAPGKEIGSFIVKYDNGRESETGYIKVDSKEEQLEYLSTYER